ncbi:RnfABCDGE type electron transport complex subunit G [Lachnospiraceae bacterium LCP25S3_G4]
MNKILKNTLILTAITLVSGVLLGLVYEVSKAPIATAQENAKKEAYQAVFESASDFEVYSDFDEKEAEEAMKDAGLTSDIISEVVVAKDGGEDAGYVITVVSKEGYGGDIKFSVGIQNDGTVNGIAILSISETAGLGMKAAEPKFQDQFKDKQVEKFEYTKSGASDDSQIDALSGATITTNAMTNGVNSALAYFQNVLGGGSANE